MPPPPPGAATAAHRAGLNLVTPEQVRMLLAGRPVPSLGGSGPGVRRRAGVCSATHRARAGRQGFIVPRSLRASEPCRRRIIPSGTRYLRVQ